MHALGALRWVAPNLALAAAVALAQSGRADAPVHYLTYTPGTLGATTATVDLRIKIFPENGDWTSTALEAELSAGPHVFFEHPLGPWCTVPSAALVATNPSLEWDSFFTDPRQYPNTSASLGAGGQCLSNLTPKARQLLWWSPPPTNGPGDWVLARFTIIDITAEWSLTISGTSTVSATGGELFPFAFVVPEPATACLMAAAAALIRRGMRAAPIRSRRP